MVWSTVTSSLRTFCCWTPSAGGSNWPTSASPRNKEPSSASYQARCHIWLLSCAPWSWRKVRRRVTVPPLRVEPTLDTFAFAVLLFCILTGFFPWERCNDSDDFYEEFADWRRSPKKTPVPSQWKRFTPMCMQMFRRMLALDPSERCSIGEIKGYVGKDWVRAKDANGWVGENGEVSTSTPSPCRSSYSDEQ